MPLTNRHGVVAVLLEYLGEGGRAFGDRAVVTRETGSSLGDGGEADGVVVAAGEQRPAEGELSAVVWKLL